MHEAEPQGPRRLVVDASGVVVCAGSLAEIFGGSDRAVLRIERNGAEVEELLLLSLRHGLYAMVNRCPHLGRTLDDGRVRGNVLQCRGHSRSYSVRTGRSVGTLAVGGPPKLHRIPAWAEGGRLFLDLTTVAPLAGTGAVSLRRRM